jgi:signal transduction histidine kinase/ABC-type amino acid transport substrate-binding protein
METFLHLLHKYITKGKGIALLCLFLCSLMTGQALAAENTKTVKVGYDLSGVLTHKEADGTFRGYNVEFLYEIAKYTNWNYEYVPYQSWDQALTAVAEGQIDLLPTVLKTPQREQTMLFANHWMGMIHVALVVPKNDRTHFYGDLPSLQGIRIGVRYNTKDADDVKAWAKAVNLTYQLSVYSDNKELLEALDAGEIDAAGLSYVGLAKKYRAIMDFAPQGMYFAVAPQRQDIKLELDSAMGQIAALNPDFYSNAMEQLTGREPNPQPVFSHAEQALIDEGKPVRVTFLRNAAPYSFLDESGKERGVLVKFLERITELSGLKFTFVQVDNAGEAIKAVHEGRADVVGRITNNLFYANLQKLRLTTPYTNLPVVQVTKPGTDVIHKVGMQEHCEMDTIQCVEANQNPSKQAAQSVNKEIQLFPTAAVMFQALENGKVDAIYCDSVTADSFAEDNGESNYKIVVMQPFTYNFTLGVGKQVDKRLAVILDKSIRCIGVKEVDEMFMQGRMEKKTTLKGLVERLPRSHLIAIGIFLLALIAGLIVALIVITRQAREKIAVMQQAAHTEQEKLKIAELEKSADEKNRFFANVSHDMRTPLNAIVGLTQLAEREPVSDTVKDYLQKIKSSGILLQDLIADTLNISRLNSGKTILKIEPVACEELFNDVVIPIKEAADKKHIEFVADRSGAACQAILADKLNLEKILLNLLSNSVKYTPEGGHIKFIIKKAATAAADTNNMIITIQDDGIGMSPEFLPHLYDSFSQENETNQGTGLGMTIVKRLVEIMNGTIDVVSAKGKGTTFTVKLPMQEATAAMVAKEQKAELKLDKLQGTKALLCEDNEINRQIAIAVLKRQGVTLVEAENGQIGVDLFEHSAPNEFSFIIMDVRMPVLDGLEATAKIRALSRADAKTVPIIALTANAFPEDVATCLAAGMNDHVAKPINPKTLYATIVKHLK